MSEAPAIIPEATLTVINVEIISTGLVLIRAASLVWVKLKTIATSAEIIESPPAAEIGASAMENPLIIVFRYPLKFINAAAWPRPLDEAELVETLPFIACVIAPPEALKLKNIPNRSEVPFSP